MFELAGLNVNRLFDVERIEPADTKILLCDDSIALARAEFTRSQIALLSKSIARQLDSLLKKRLSKGLKGTSIAVYMPNGAEYVPTFIGIACGGGVNCLLNPKYKEAEISFAVEDLGCSGILVAKGAKNDEAFASGKKLNVPVLEMQWILVDKKLELELMWADTSEKAQSDSEYKFCDNSFSDVALKLHTSGTTSRPKTVPLTHGNIVITCLNQANTFAWKSRSDRSLLLMPLFHVHGLFNGCLGPLSHKCYVAIPQTKSFSKSHVWADLERHQVNLITAVPSILQIMFLDVTEPITNVKFRYIRACSSALAPPLAEKIGKLTNAPILESYAMTEATHQMCSNVVGHTQLGSIGFPCGMELAIIDGNTGDLCDFDQPGEICVRGLNVIEGYENLDAAANKANFRYPEDLKGFDKPNGAYVSSIPNVAAILEQAKNSGGDKDEFFANFKSEYRFEVPGKFCKDLTKSPRRDKGFLRTGDLGSMNSDGRVTYIGRLKELINRGGEKISPIEIDAAYLRLDGVKYASAFSIHDDILGEKVAIAIVPEDSDSSKFEALAKNMTAQVKQYLSTFKIPCVTYFCEELPTGPSGKVLRRQLLEHVTEKKCPSF